LNVVQGVNPNIRNPASANAQKRRREKIKPPNTNNIFFFPFLNRDSAFFSDVESMTSYPIKPENQLLLSRKKRLLYDVE
jgi:hypothetical protein